MNPAIIVALVLAGLAGISVAIRKWMDRRHGK